MTSIYTENTVNDIVLIAQTIAQVCDWGYIGVEVAVFGIEITFAVDNKHVTAHIPKTAWKTSGGARLAATMVHGVYKALEGYRLMGGEDD